jgi:hypothetical protein
VVKPSPLRHNNPDQQQKITKNNMSAYFPERANAFIDDHIVTPLLAKEYEEAANINSYKYDPESNMRKRDADEGSEFTRPTTLETNSQEDLSGVSFKKYDVAASGPRRCCPQLLKSSLIILLAVGNVTAWVLSFLYSPFDVSHWNSVLVYIAGVICLITTLLMIVNERRISTYPTSEYNLFHFLPHCFFCFLTFTFYLLDLIEMVSEVQTYNRELILQVDSLREEAHHLMLRATRCEAAEIKLREIAQQRGLHGNELISLVQENENILDLLRKNKRERVIEEVVRIILRNGSPIMNEATAKLLAREISVKMEEIDVLFDEEKFIQALASNPTLLGAISTVKKLLPDEDYNHEKDDAHNMFYLSNEEQISKGSVHAARAILDGKQMSLAQRFHRGVRKRYSSSDEWDKKASSDGEDPERPKSRILRQFWIMAMPYFRENREGRCLFLVLIVITLGTSAVNVYYSYLIRDFYTALTKKQVDVFYKCFFKFLASLLVLIPVQVSFRYMHTKLGIAWRKWLTEVSMR